jgi:hypothetical protein
MKGKNVIDPARSAFDEPAEDAVTTEDLNPHLQPPPPLPWKKSTVEEIQRLKDELAAAKAELVSRPDIPIDRALIPIADGVRALGNFRLSRQALIVPDQMSRDELTTVSEFVREMRQAMQFWIGDLTRAWSTIPDGPKYTEIADYFSLNPKTLQNWTYVCERIPIPFRNGILDFTHYVVLAHLPAELESQVRDIQDHAEKNGLSVQDLRDYIRLLKKKKPRPVPANILFSKDRTPGLMEIRKDYALAKKGDKQAMDRVRSHLQVIRDWTKDIEQSLGLK